MKNVIPILASAILIISACNNSGNGVSLAMDGVANNKSDKQLKSIDPDHLFTLSDAEKILGEGAHLIDSSTTINGNIFRYSCAYCANAKESNSGKTGCIYFLIEKYDQVPSAQKKYSSIKKANENHEGIKVIQDMGEEAYFHSDKQNFYFIMVRKGKNVFNMKVNKITSKTSLDDFNLVAKKITDLL